MSAMNEITPADMMRLQNDNYNLQAAESLPFMLQQSDSVSLTCQEHELIALTRIVGLCKHRAQSQAATYYEVWYNTLYRNIWDEMTSSTASLSLPSDYTTIKLMKTDSAWSFYDIRSTPEKETLKMLIGQTFTKSIDMVEVWKAENEKEPEWGFIQGYEDWTPA